MPCLYFTGFWQEFLASKKASIYADYTWYRVQKLERKPKLVRVGECGFGGEK